MIFSMGIVSIIRKIFISYRGFGGGVCFFGGGWVWFVGDDIFVIIFFEGVVWVFRCVVIFIIFGLEFFIGVLYSFILVYKKLKKIVN